MIGEPNADNRAAIEQYGHVPVLAEMPLLTPLDPGLLGAWSVTHLDPQGRLLEFCDEPERARPRTRVASLHADADAAAAAADRARRGRVSLHRRRTQDSRRHLVVVGEHSRAFASQAECGAGGAGWRARARDLRRVHAPAGGRTRRAAGRGAAAGSQARVLFRQRIDGGRSGDEDGAPVLAQSRRAAAQRG